MKKRGLLFLFSLFCVVFMLPCSFALFETQIYSGTVQHGQMVEAENIELEFKYDFTSKKAFVKIDGSGIIVEEGACEVRNNVDVCIENITFAFRNATTLFDVYKSKVTVYKVTTDLSVTHTIAEDSLFIGEQVNAHIKFSNNGDVIAENFRSVITVPEELEVIETNNCELTNEGIVFDENINPTNTKTCSYSVKAIKSGEFELSANSSFFDGISDTSVITKASGAVENASLDVAIVSENNTFGLTKDFNYSFRITNINEEIDIAISSLVISFPEEVVVDKKSIDTSKSSGGYTWSKTLSASASENLTFELHSERTGTHTVVVDSVYKESGFTRNAQHTFDIEIECDCPRIDYSAFTESDHLSVLLVNPNQEQEFTDIVVEVDVDGVLSTQHFDTIKSNGHISILETTLSEVSTVLLDASFNTEFGEGISISKKITIANNTDSINETKKDVIVEVIEPIADSSKDDENKDTQEEVNETEQTQNESDSNLQGNEIKEKIEEQKQQVVAVATTEVDRNTITDIVIYGGIAFAALLFIAIVLMLRKGRVQKVKGKTLDDIEMQLAAIEAKNYAKRKKEK